MPFPEQPRYVAALTKRMSVLRQADDRRDEDTVWELTCEVLGWLYRADQAAQASDDTYLTRRAASVAGRTLAGLIWIRGRVDHHAAEVRRLIVRPASPHVFDGVEWRPASLQVYDGERWNPGGAARRFSCLAGAGGDPERSPRTASARPVL